MKDQYIKHIFITSLITAIVIFSSGILVGWVLDDYRTDEVLDTIKTNELNSQSYMIEQTFLENVGDGEISCEVLTPRIENIGKELGETGQELQIYGSASDFKKDEFEYLKRRYFLMEINFYNLITQYRDACEDKYTPILYFYRIDDKQSTLQGYVLDEFVKSYNDNAYGEDDDHGKIIVLSIDGEFEKDPLIKTIMNTYDIKPVDLPAMVIDYDTLRKGFVDREEFEEIFDINIDKNTNNTR